MANIFEKNQNIDKREKALSTTIPPTFDGEISEL